MGAVTSAVRSGLLTKEDRGIGHGLTNGISEKSITQGGGFSITINENNMEDTTKAVENAPRSSGVNGGNNDEKSEPPVVVAQEEEEEEGSVHVREGESEKEEGRRSLCCDEPG